MFEAKLYFTVSKNYADYDYERFKNFYRGS